jgi:PilZ domain
VSDRRADPRYDVIGALWGVLELHEEARLRNVSATGVLLDSPVPMALDSAQTIRLEVDGQSVTVDARVRHVRQQRYDASGPLYAVGLEFIEPPTPVLQSIEQLSSVNSFEPDSPADARNGRDAVKGVPYDRKASVDAGTP